MPRDLPTNLPVPLTPPSLSHHAIDLSTWSRMYQQYDNLAVGALIFRHLPTQPRHVLLLKRASTDYCPNFWEPPGGSVDPQDKTLLDAILREVWEETGLRVRGFRRQIWDKVCTEGKDQPEVEFLGGGGEKWCKLNFLVDVVEGEEVRLDELEHQDYGWFEREEVERLPFVSEQALNIVRNAFNAFEEGEMGGERTATSCLT